MPLNTITLLLFALFAVGLGVLLALAYAWRVGYARRLELERKVNAQLVGLSPKDLRRH